MIETEIDRDALIERIDELLEARYRSADLFNCDDPLEETVFILLSRQARGPDHRRVFADLRRRYPRWLDVLEAPAEELEAVLEPAGFHRQRSAQLRALLEAVRQADVNRSAGPAAFPPGDLTLGFLAAMDDAEAEAFLLSLPGVGLKGAQCVLSYSLDRATFAVDTHARRVLSRLDIVPSPDGKADHDLFQAAGSKDKRKRLHANLVHHGREVCRSSNEHCEECVLVSFCTHGRNVVSKRRAGPVVVDLFSGVGGLGFGFHSEGYHVAIAVEASRHAAQTYRVNNPGTPVVEATIDGGTTASSLRRFMPQITKIDVLVAGPPCQGYSTAGLQRPEDPRNQLYEHVARLARELEVSHVVFENVLGVRNVNGHDFRYDIIDSLERAGFAVTLHLLCALDFGVPQRRVRYFFLASRDPRHQPIPAPMPTHRRQGELSAKVPDRPETPTVLEALAELPYLEAGVEAERLLLDDGREFWNMSTVGHAPWVIQKIASTKRGQESRHYDRLNLVEAQTILSVLPVHPIHHRTISTREAAVLQGFPLDYFFCGPRAHQSLQVANAVPPPLASAVARQLKDRCGPAAEGPCDRPGSDEPMDCRAAVIPSR